MPAWHHYAIFGVALRSSLELPLLVPAAPGSPPNTPIPGLSLQQVDNVMVHYDTTAIVTIHTSNRRAATGLPVVTLQQAANTTIVRFGSGVDYAIGDNGSVLFSTTPYATRDDVQIALLGVVLAYWLERHGASVLHAAVVAIGGRAVGLMADSQAGKSTLAAALVAAGHPLLSDDLLVCRNEAGAIIAQPGFPAMRMWPDTARQMLGNPTGLEPVRAGSDKRRVPLATTGDSGGFGHFHAEAAALACIYVPHRDSTHSQSPKISQQAPAQAAAMLVRHSVLSRALRASGASAAQLSRLAGLAARVPVRTVRYSDGYDQLPEVCAAIQRDMTGSRVQATPPAEHYR